jgi:hypothetical protein
MITDITMVNQQETFPQQYISSYAFDGFAGLL